MPSPSTLRFALAVLAITAVLLIAPASARPRSAERRPTYEADEEMIEGLPDYTDPVIGRKMKCSACKALVSEVYEKLIRIYKFRHGQPKSYELIEEMEGMCRTLKDEYGLLKRNNKATTEFSRNEAITRLKGAWINTFIEGRCGEILTTHEDAIAEHYAKVRNVGELQQMVCVKWDRSCTREEAERDEL